MANGLTDTAIKKTKATGKIQKLNDGEGLRLEITKAGTKVFKYRFSIGGKRSDFVIGKYPSISLAQARIKRDKAKALLIDGINPNDHKKEQQQAKQLEQQYKTEKLNRMTFGVLFNEWYNHNLASWKPEHSKDLHQRATKHLLPKLKAMPLEEINPMLMIEVLKEIEAKGRLETTNIIKNIASRVFRYGVGMGHCETNPAGDLPNDIFKKQTKKQMPHTTKPKELAQILRAIDEYIGDISTKKALELAPYVFLRPKELSSIKWEYIDLAKKTIEIPPEQMKKKRPHLVPISSKVLEIIEFMTPLTGDDIYLFTSPRNKKRPINEQTLNPALHRLGFKGIQTIHGFRHTASTMLNEMGYNGDWIEKQLAHEQDSVRAVYNKAEYLEQRAKMMQSWAGYLDGLKEGNNVVQFKKKQG